MKELKKELVKQIENNNILEASKIIDKIVENFDAKAFYSDFGTGEKSLDAFPIMAALFYGREEMFEMMLEKIPHLNENLHRAVSADHVLVNVATFPCTIAGKINSEALSKAQTILKKINSKLSDDQKIAAKLFPLAVFFLHEDLVDEYMRDSNFANHANLKGTRSATAVNFAVSTSDLNHSSKRIAAKLLENDLVLRDLQNNPNIVNQLVNTHHYQTLAYLIQNNFIKSSDLMFPALIQSILTADDNSDSKAIENLLSNTIQNSKGYNFIFAIEPILQSVPAKYINIVLKEALIKLKSDFESGKITIRDIYFGNTDSLPVGSPSFVDHLIIVHESTLNEIKFSDDDKEFIKNRKVELLQQQAEYEETVKKQKAKLSTFKKEIENANEVWYHTLRRGVDANSKSDMPFGHSRTEESRRSEVLLRLFLVLGSGNLHVKMNKNSEWSAPSLPLSLEFGCGARTLIEIPPVKNLDEQNQFFNWVTCGAPLPGSHFNNNVSNQTSGALTIEDNKIIQTRTFATHGLVPVDQQHLSEEKLGVQNIVPTLGMIGRGISTNLGFNDFTGHFGMNFGVGKYGSFDIKGKTTRPDGATGHLYMFYRPPTLTEPGGLLVGVEGSEPHVEGQYGNHSMLGSSDPLTVAGGRQSDDLRKEFEEAKDSVGLRYNGRRVVLSDESIGSLYSYNLSNLQDCGLLALVKPQQNLFTLNGIITSDEYKNVERTKKQEDNYKLSFEVLTSPYVTILNEDLKSKLLAVISKLSNERNDSLTGNERSGLKEEYEQVFKSVKKVLEETFQVNSLTHVEEFRKSVEIFLASLGRNSRLALAYEVHKEVIGKPDLICYGNNVIPRAYIVSNYLHSTYVQNREQGLGLAPRLTPSEVNHGIRRILASNNIPHSLSDSNIYDYLEDGKSLSVDKGETKLIITPAANDYPDEDIGKINYAMAGSVNIGEALNNTLKDPQNHKLFRDGKLEIAIPYVQALTSFGGLVPRNHFTMLHVKFDAKQNKVLVTNFDSKSSHNVYLYPLYHLNSWVERAAKTIGPDVKFEIIQKACGWQPVFNVTDCGRFVMTMVKHLANNSVESLATLKSSEVVREVINLARRDEDLKIYSITEKYSVSKNQMLHECLLGLYTNTKSPTDSDLAKLLDDYKKTLDYIVKTDTKFRIDDFRSEVENLLGNAGKIRRLQGAYQVHKEVMESNGIGTPTPAYALSSIKWVKSIIGTSLSYVFSFLSSASSSAATNSSTKADVSSPPYRPKTPENHPTPDLK